MYPDRDTLSKVPRSSYITARGQSMVESGVTEGGKNTARSCQLFFSMNEHNNTNTKPQAKKQRFFKVILKVPRRETAASVEEKDADNIRKVLSKSFIQWF